MMGSDPKTEAGATLRETVGRYVVAVTRRGSGHVTAAEVQAAYEAMYDAMSAPARLVSPADREPNPDLEEAHAALASALLWLDGEYRDTPRDQFNWEAWAATARKGLAALVAARQPEPAAPAVPEDGRSRLRDHAPGVSPADREGRFSDGPVGESRDIAWLIQYEDPDHSTEVFVGGDSEGTARRRFHDARQMWNCTLFRQYAPMGWDSPDARTARLGQREDIPLNADLLARAVIVTNYPKDYGHTGQAAKAYAVSLAAEYQRLRECQP